MTWTVRPGAVYGEATVAGDKSIAHRALMVASLASAPSSVANLPEGADVQSTARCLRSLGVQVHSDGTGVSVSPPARLAPPSTDLDAGNSGTTMRLLAGVLAAQPFASRLVGDDSLSRRPMRRVIEPLTRMGARIESLEGNAPLLVHGGPLRGCEHAPEVASAQVKSAILLAGLFAVGRTVVHEQLPTRDHTERMLEAAHVSLRWRPGYVEVVGPQRPDSFALQVPGDASSAAFLFAAAALTGGAVLVRGIGVNPHRTGFLDILARMGVRVDVENQREVMGEPVADVRVSGRVVRPISVMPAEVPRMIDELPLVALVATQAPGASTIAGAEELRVKESDRIAAVTDVLRHMNADVTARDDGFVVRGPAQLSGIRAAPSGDHRLVMMTAVAGLVARGVTQIVDHSAAGVSFPGFASALERLGAAVDVR